MMEGRTKSPIIHLLRVSMVEDALMMRSPFSLYSNQEIRMDRLLFRRTNCDLIPSDTGIDDIMDTSTTNTDAATSLPRRPPKRLTRLSFEVHPSLVLDPLLLLAGGEMTSAPAMISFNENESTAK